MIHQLIERLLKRRHFWRYATFSEVGELYASRLLRVFALRFVAVFTSVYLFKLGYDIVFLSFFWAGFYIFKMLISWHSVKIAAYFGPKHGTLYANITAALSMLFLFLVPVYGLPVLVLWAAMQAFSSTLYELCYLIDFSKVKSVDHAGKEIGFMSIIEKVASGLSPLIGGVIAALFGPALAIVFSAILFISSSIPLLQTREPTRLRQKVVMKNFPWHRTWRSLIAESAIGVDVYVSGSAWILFITIIVFANDGNELYAKIGTLSALTIFGASISAYVFGRLIDRKHGRQLLRWSVLANSIVHLLRPFSTNAIGVLANNTANDVASTGYSMAFTRGLFNSVDETGHRMAYMFMVVLAANAGAALAGIVMGVVFLLLVNDYYGFIVFFLICSVLTLLIATPRFSLYKK